jgi:hypothetical protein
MVAVEGGERTSTPRGLKWTMGRPGMDEREVRRAVDWVAST